MTNTNTTPAAELNTGDVYSFYAMAPRTVVYVEKSTNNPADVLVCYTVNTPGVATGQAAEYIPARSMVKLVRKAA